MRLLRFAACLLETTHELHPRRISLLASTLTGDDDVTFCEVLGAALNKRGFAVQIAHNVDEALCLAEACPPDYAVVDLKMPGPSGLDLVAKLCAQDSDLKVVVLTGYASIVTAVEAIKLGATYYLTKPTDADDIVAAFQRKQGIPRHLYYRRSRSQ